MLPKNPKQTGNDVKSKAGKDLQDSKTPKKYRAEIASALSQAPLKPKPKSKKK